MKDKYHNVSQRGTGAARGGRCWWVALPLGWAPHSPPLVM